MGPNVVIQAEGLGKQYRLGQEAGRARYTALRDVVADWARSAAKGKVFHGRGKAAALVSEEFWALRDISFDIKRGEVVGVIGRNGAGKSTLLKVLSRITEPSEGRVAVKGRIASLLEVGTGFHPELTGRENIYLNGAILGMTRAEVRHKFDEIVDFAEVERFLDTPVKRYSSGMYVRLAFAVAAHLEPEILIVDEVLAVGDAEFQKKCLGKMQAVAGHGRTVLFVSHNMTAVSSLCTRGLLLEAGRLIFAGTAGEVIKRYTDATVEENEVSFAADPSKPSISQVTIDRDLLRDRHLKIHVAWESPTPLHTPIGGLIFRSVSGEPVWGSNGRFHPRLREETGLSAGILTCEAPGLPLQPGQYLVSVWLADWHTDHDYKIDCIRITIGDDRIDTLRPPPAIIGYLDWTATWGSGPC